MAFSPSMKQSLTTTVSIYNLTFNILDHIKWKKIKNPLILSLAQSVTLYSGIIVLTYFPLGDSWLHEEFHRSILTYHGIKSHDQVYDFPVFSELISVNNVSDSALAAFKSSSPQDFVRMHEAGIKGEYLLINRLNSLSFFHNQTYPYFISNMLITLNSIFTFGTATPAMQRKPPMSSTGQRLQLVREILWGWISQHGSMICLIHISIMKLAAYIPVAWE